ncbi:MAG: glutamate racemase [Ruminococcaceae bacterium]|nr:glutamate racemase [Oscillospiraceae bacterium]
MSKKNELPIAVLDSGVGGISVLRELMRIMPNENYLYYGDSANAPYGEKSAVEVLNITKKNVLYLKRTGIKCLVIACNTATSAAVKTLRRENPELPIIGIEPAIKPPAVMLENPRVLVMATPLTLKEKKFCELVERFSDKEEIIPLPCPALVELIESGELESEKTDKYIAELLAPYKNEKIDAVVLGCTHYPHIRPIIEKNLPQGVMIIDGAEGTARHTYNRLSKLDLLRKNFKVGTVKIINTSKEPRLAVLSKKLLYR